MYTDQLKKKEDLFKVNESGEFFFSFELDKKVAQFSDPVGVVQIMDWSHKYSPYFQLEL